MAQWKKSSPELVARFDAVFPAGEAIERRLMFGYPAAFVNGNMFAGLFQESLLLRLADAARHELLKLPGASVFEPMPGRPMREYVVVPPLVRDDPAQLARWMKRALAYASGMPAKKKAPAAKKKSRAKAGA